MGDRWMYGVCLAILFAPLVYLFAKFFEMMICDLLGKGDEWRM